MIELLVVAVIIPIIVGAIATAVITSMKDQNGVSGRLSDSASAQVTSSFYVRDVQSAAYVTTSATSSPAPCGSGTTFVLGLSWGSPTAGGTVVSYWLDPTPGNPTPATNDLLRLYCSGGSTTPASTVTVDHGLLTSSGIRSDIAPPSNATAAATNWASTSGISGITLQAQESSSTYDFDLLAVPRGSAATVGNGGNPAPPPLLLLGSGTSVVSCVGNGSLRVIGTAYLDSTANGSANLTGSASFNATQIYTADPNPSQAITGSGSYSPNPVNGPVVSDPYASLTPPSANGLPVYSDGNYHGPGVYTTTLSFSGSGSQALATGTYILQQGISVTGQASLTTAPGGVLLYVSGGSIQLGGGGNVSLEPLSPPPYPSSPNLGIWQAKSDTNTISLSGNGSVNTYGGTIYAPGAQVGGVGNAGYTAGSIVSSSFACTGNGTATIG
jgi:hypothetical protein